MNKEYLLSVLHSIYDWPISDDSAWRVYNNFVEMCNTEDFAMRDYLFDLINLNKKERLVFRNRVAELGFELRPDEVDQYIFLIVMAMASTNGAKLENI